MSKDMETLTGQRDPLEPIDGKEAKDRFKNALKSIPNFGKLLFRLARDPRVPRKNKVIFGAIAVYLVVPFDLIPDWLPGIGQLDDLILIVLALDAMVNRVPHEILAEHWDGDSDVLETIQSLLDIASGFVPARLKRRLFGGESESDLDEEF